MSGLGSKHDREYCSFDLDTNGDVARRVIDALAHDKLDAIIAALGGSSGTAFFAEASGTTTGAVQTVLTDTVPGSTTRSLVQVVVSTFSPGKVSVEIAGTEVASGRTAPGKPDVVLTFNPNRPASASDTIDVKFNGRISGTDIEAYLFALDT